MRSAEAPTWISRRLPRHRHSAARPPSLGSRVCLQIGLLSSRSTLHPGIHVPEKSTSHWMSSSESRRAQNSSEESASSAMTADSGVIDVSVTGRLGFPAPLPPVNTHQIG